MPAEDIWFVCQSDDRRPFKDTVLRIWGKLCVSPRKSPPHGGQLGKQTWGISEGIFHKPGH